MKECDLRIIKMNIAHYEAMLMLKLGDTKRLIIDGLLLEARRVLALTATAARAA